MRRGKRFDSGDIYFFIIFFSGPAGPDDGPDAQQSRRPGKPTGAMGPRPGPLRSGPQDATAFQGPAERTRKATARQDGLSRGPRNAGPVPGNTFGSKNGLEGCSRKKAQRSRGKRRRTEGHQNFFTFSGNFIFIMKYNTDHGMGDGRKYMDLLRNYRPFTVFFMGRERGSKWMEGRDIP